VRGVKYFNQHMFVAVHTHISKTAFPDLLRVVVAWSFSNNQTICYLVLWVMSYFDSSNLRLVSLPSAGSSCLCYSSGASSPLSSDRQHLSCDVCLEVRGEIIRTVLFCIVY